MKEENWDVVDLIEVDKTGEAFIVYRRDKCYKGFTGRKEIGVGVLIFKKI